VCGSITQNRGNHFCGYKSTDSISVTFFHILLWDGVVSLVCAAPVLWLRPRKLSFPRIVSCANVNTRNWMSSAAHVTPVHISITNCYVTATQNPLKMPFVFRVSECVMQNLKEKAFVSWNGNEVIHDEKQILGTFFLLPSFACFYVSHSTLLFIMKCTSLECQQFIIYFFNMALHYVVL